MQTTGRREEQFTTVVLALYASVVVAGFVASGYRVRALVAGFGAMLCSGRSVTVGGALLPRQFEPSERPSRATAMWRSAVRLRWILAATVLLGLTTTAGMVVEAQGTSALGALLAIAASAVFVGPVVQVFRRPFAADFTSNWVLLRQHR